MSIKVNHLTKIYGTQKAVDDISFEVHAGEILGFLGPNGAGKTTTMKIITCFIPQTSGSASICDFDVNTHPIAIRKNIGYLAEHNPLYSEMYVKEYLAFIAQLHHLGKSAKKKIEEIIEITGLGLEQKKKIGQLSKGYRQRVGLAQAMIHDPKVLILDEPTSGLDPNQLVEIRNVIKTIGQEKTVILSTHIMQEVQAICDRVIIIHKGKIVADDTTERLQEKTAGDIIITVEFKQKTTKEQLAKIKGVKSTKSLTNNKWQLNTSKDIRPAIFDFAVQNKLTLLAMQKESYSLEEVFKQLTIDN